MITRYSTGGVIFPPAPPPEPLPPSPFPAIEAAVAASAELHRSLGLPPCWQPKASRWTCPVSKVTQFRRALSTGFFSINETPFDRWVGSSYIVCTNAGEPMLSVHAVGRALVGDIRRWLLASLEGGHPGAAQGCEPLVEPLRPFFVEGDAESFVELAERGGALAVQQSLVVPVVMEYGGMESDPESWKRRVVAVFRDSDEAKVFADVCDTAYHTARVAAGRAVLERTPWDWRHPLFPPGSDADENVGVYFEAGTPAPFEPEWRSKVRPGIPVPPRTTGRKA